MKKIVFAVIALASVVALADRVVTLSTSRSKTTEVRAMSLADGGCAAVACGDLKDSAGNYKGTTCTPTTEFAAGSAAQTRCLNILSSGDALWRAQEGVQ